MEFKKVITLIITIVVIGLLTTCEGQVTEIKSTRQLHLFSNKLVDYPLNIIKGEQCIKIYSHIYSIYREEENGDVFFTRNKINFLMSLKEDMVYIYKLKENHNKELIIKILKVQYYYNDNTIVLCE